MGFTEEEVYEIKKIILEKRKKDLEEELAEIKEAENSIVSKKNKEELIKYFKEDEDD